MVLLLFKAFLTSLSLLLIAFLSLIFSTGDNFVHLRWVILGKSALFCCFILCIKFNFFQFIFANIPLSTSVIVFILAVIYSC